MAGAEQGRADYTVSFNPPAYPPGFFPSRCKHEPQFIMCAGTRIAKAKRGSQIEVDHSVCLACGSAQPCTIGGNILVDLAALWAEKGWHVQIGMRVMDARDKWARIAAHLFGPKGWNGRHERIARMIDPNLTMRLSFKKSATRDGTRVGFMRFDPAYVRAAAPAEGR